MKINPRKSNAVPQDEEDNEDQA